MAGEFVPDGHKYGLKWAAPWGAAQNTYGGDTRNLFFSQVVFVASVEGVPVTLGLDGWYMEGRDTAPAGNIGANTADATHVLYFRLAYDPETKQACAFNSTYVPDLPAQPLADNQVLVRLTFNLGSSQARPMAQVTSVSGLIIHRRAQVGICALSSRIQKKSRFIASRWALPPSPAVR